MRELALSHLSSFGLFKKDLKRSTRFPSNHLIPCLLPFDINQTHCIFARQRTPKYTHATEDTNLCTYVKVWMLRLEVPFLGLTICK